MSLAIVVIAIDAAIALLLGWATHRRAYPTDPAQLPGARIMLRRMERDRADLRAQLPSNRIVHTRWF